MSETRAGESSAFFGRWRTSHYSYETGACCEVLNLTTGESWFRDSQNPEAARLRFDNFEWTTFLTLSKGAF
ncbi:DUF397 domain-containing protein [Nocardiopsis aegyptia]